MNYRLPTAHEREAEQADSRFIRCEHDIRMSDTDIREMNERIAKRRAEFLQRARNLKGSKQTTQKAGEE
jgi:hypothetical protein